MFGDEFNGSTLDSSKWKTCEECRSGSELSVNRAENAFLNGAGQLVIRAENRGSIANPEWTSAWVWTNDTFNFKHGKVEIRAKMPHGTGLWPALWMAPWVEWPPEIDIFEAVDSEHRYWVNIHYGSERSSSQFYGDRGPHPIENVDTSQWQTYGIEWVPGEVRFTLNGNVVAKVNEGVQELDAASPMYLIMNMYVGGEWPQPPDATTPQRADMLIDYVRVYQQ